MIATVATALLSGAFTWSLLEYGIHRWIGHRRGATNLASREHIQHHVGVDYFAPAHTKVLAALPVVSALGALAAVATSLPVGIAYATGVSVGWLGYEVLHRRIHVAAPRGPYGRWARRHHLAHHFTSAKMNHGVTSPLWDVVFGTYRPSPSVKIPPRHAHKFAWMLTPGETPTVAPAFASDFTVG